MLHWKRKVSSQAGKVTFDKAKHRVFKPFQEHKQKKNIYTGYTVYNLKPKQFCVQNVSTVSTTGLQPILNPLSPPFLATRYNCPCLG